MSQAEVYVLLLRSSTSSFITFIAFIKMDLPRTDILALACLRDRQVETRLADHTGSAGASPYQIGRDSQVIAATKSDSDRRIRARDSAARSLHYTPCRSCLVPQTPPTNRDGLLPVHVSR